MLHFKFSKCMCLCNTWIIVTTKKDGNKNKKKKKWEEREEREKSNQPFSRAAVVQTGLLAAAGFPMHKTNSRILVVCWAVFVRLLGCCWIIYYWAYLPTASATCGPWACSIWKQTHLSPLRHSDFFSLCVGPKYIWSPWRDREAIGCWTHLLFPAAEAPPRSARPPASAPPRPHPAILLHLLRPRRSLLPCSLLSLAAPPRSAKQPPDGRS